MAKLIVTFTGTATFRTADTRFPGPFLHSLALSPVFSGDRKGVDMGAFPAIPAGPISTPPASEPRWTPIRSVRPTLARDSRSYTVTGRKGDPATIEWRILDCSHAQLTEGGAVNRELKPEPNQTTIGGSAAIKIDRPTQFAIHSVSSSGRTKLITSKLVNIAACSGGRDPQEYTFCVSCAPYSKATAYVNACTEQEAKEECSTAAARSRLACAP